MDKCKRSARNIARSGWRVALAGAAMLGSLSPVFASAADVPIGLAAELRVAAIGQRLAMANRATCPRLAARSGLLLDDLSAYPLAARAALAQAIGPGFRIRAVIPDSAGARAGLVAGDRIAAMNGRDLSQFDREDIGPRASFARIERFEAMQQMLPENAESLVVQRSEASLAVSLRLDQGCAGRFVLMPGKKFDAWSDGVDVAITAQAEQQLVSDDELAFVLGHELGHNWLDQSRGRLTLPSTTADFGPLNLEERADLIGVITMMHAGFNPAQAVAVLCSTSRDFEHRSGNVSRSLSTRAELIRKEFKLTKLATDHC